MSGTEAGRFAVGRSAGIAETVTEADALPFAAVSGGANPVPPLAPT